MQVVERKVVSKIYGHGRGWTFTPMNFASLGDSRTVGMALTRLNRKGIIRRLARGLYDYPDHDKLIGTLSPSVDALTKALRDRDATRLLPSGAYAANLLGLSNQVPMTVVFLTDGASRNVRLGNMQIILKRTTPRNLATADSASGLVIQALRHIGKDHVDDAMIATLRSRLSDADKKRLLKDIGFAPAWIAKRIRQITG